MPLRSSDDDFVNEVTEEHLYRYMDTDMPTAMDMVKNHKDTLHVLFSNDEHGNVAIEKNTHDASKYYYYYDAQNRVTDVVKASQFRSRLVAVYVMEYDRNGNVTQLTITEEGSPNFYIWRYDYENGLRMKERLFDSNRKIMGKVEYEYN